jgi:hypothetical protein
MASALRRLVGEIENARAEGLRVDELQRLLIAPVPKQTLSARHDYGMHLYVYLDNARYTEGTLYSIQKW